MRTLPDGKLSVDPPQVTLADIANVPPQSPQATLLRLWFGVQWGADPMITDSYAPQIATAIRPQRLVAAWDLRRNLLIGARPRILDVARDGDTRVVTYLLESRGATPDPESATMVANGGGWRIVHDTLLEDALAAYATSAAKDAGQSDRDAAATGNASRREYRDLADAFTGSATRGR